MPESIQSRCRYDGRTNGVRFFSVSKPVQLLWTERFVVLEDEWIFAGFCNQNYDGIFTSVWACLIFEDSVGSVCNIFYIGF